MCAAVLGIAGVVGYPLTEAQAKTVYWELSSGAEETVDAPRTQSEATAKESGETLEKDVQGDAAAAKESGDALEKDAQGDAATAAEWTGTKLVDEEYANYVAEEFQYLEKFDVTFDKETGIFYYDDRKIRWLIDELAETNTQKCCYNENGVIDVYTVRDKNGDLEGVRVADNEEFRQKTDRMNHAVLIEEGDDASREGDVTAVAQDSSGSYGGNCESVERTYVIEEGSSNDGSSEASGGNSAAGFDSGNADGDYLFSALGLSAGKNRHWLYKGREAAAIYIKDISITTWGDVEDGVYLYVTKEQKEDSITWNIREVSKEKFEEVCGMR